MMNRVELNEKIMSQVSGGKLRASESQDYKNQIHPGCGGHISGKGTILEKCKCDKCNLIQYWYDDYFHWDDPDDDDWDIYPC